MSEDSEEHTGGRSEVPALPSTWAWLGLGLCDTPTQWRDRFKLMKDSGIDGIFCSYNGRALNDASHDHRRAASKLRFLIETASKLEMQVHAWTQVMPCNEEDVIEAHPEWYAVNGCGESAATHPAYVDYYRFLCPSREGAQYYLQIRVNELAMIDGLAGVHLDYIRFPDVILAKELQPKYNIVQDREYPEYDYCYCDACCDAFKEQTGIDPKELEDPASSQEWRQFRYDRITTLVNDILAPTIRGHGKMVTAAVFPNWEHVRQQWFNWHLDAAFPMLYHQFYGEDVSWIGQQCAKLRDMLPNRVKLYSGLYIPALAPEELPRAMDISLINGADGVSVFDANAIKAGHWRALKGAKEAQDVQSRQ